jgi:hypothetical protein
MAETATAAPAATPNGWAGVWGFLDGAGGAVSRLGGIVNTVSDGAEDIARGRRAIHEEQQDRQERELGLALRLAGFERGDNKLTIFAVAAAAVAVIVLMR